VYVGESHIAIFACEQKDGVDGVDELFLEGGVNICVLAPFAEGFGVLLDGLCDLGGGGSISLGGKRSGERWVGLSNGGDGGIERGAQEETEVSMVASSAGGGH